MTAKTPPPAKLGTSVTKGPGTWVQTERKAHESWARLTMRKPRAAALMHHLVARIGHQNAIVVPQKVLAKLMGCSIDTVQRALRDLESEKWVQIVKLNGPGTVSAYIVNDQVAWGQSRGQLRLSTFSAMVVADAEDQDTITLEHSDLRRIPVIFPGEQQLPTGPGEKPPTQPILDGFEPELPSLNAEYPEPWAEKRAELAVSDQAGVPRTMPKPDRDPSTVDWVDDIAD